MERVKDDLDLAENVLKTLIYGKQEINPVISFSQSLRQLRMINYILNNLHNFGDWQMMYINGIWIK